MTETLILYQSNSGLILTERKFKERILKEKNITATKSKFQPIKKGARPA